MFYKMLFLGLLTVFLMMRPCVVSADNVAETQNSKMEGTRMDKKTREILDIFKEISTIPRCSGDEKNITNWLEKWAQNNGLKVRTDRMGNVVIKIPATKGYEKAAGIVVQGHLDMVCEKTPESKHDFSKDPIRLVYDGDWLKADKTTLGADNGIGIALCLALAKDETIAHPPLELLFTVEEESGLNGAGSLQSGFIEGHVFINIDSEEEGIFTVGSAGGRVLLIGLPISTEPFPKTFKAYKLQIHGLRGGHSGVDIHKHRGNANKILAKALNVVNRSSEIKLLSMKGGTRASAIPRDAEALIGCEPSQLPTLQKVISEFEQTIQREYASSDPSLSIRLSEIDSGDFPRSALVQKDTDNAIILLSALPDGVVEMSSDIEGLVETSNNVATIELTEKALTILSFQRSSMLAKLDDVTSTIENTAAQVGARVRIVGEFSAWEPNMQSPLLKQCQEVYRDLFKEEPEVSVIHAGLECSVIGAKFPGLDMISLGPTIEDPHSPDEKLYIPSIGKMWDFLVAFLRSYSK
jgi:dipeptidase D